MMSKPTWDFDASQILRVEAWPIERLTPYAKNPRHTTEAAIAAVAESLSRFGWQQPIVATSGGTIVAGHTRHRAAQKLEMAQVPVQVISEEDAAAYRLIDNRTGDLTTWDLDLLPAELEVVSDLEAFDFAALLPPPNVGQTDPDDVPETPPASTKTTKSGDIWELGKHRLICGDSTDPGIVAQLLDGQRCDTVVFDPPFDRHDLYDQIPPSSADETLLLFYASYNVAVAIGKAVGKHWSSGDELIWDCGSSWNIKNHPLQRHKAVTIFRDNPTWDFDASIVDDGVTRKPKRATKSKDGKPVAHHVLPRGVHLQTVQQFSISVVVGDAGPHSKPVEWIQAILGGVRARRVLDL